MNNKSNLVGILLICPLLGVVCFFACLIVYGEPLPFLGDRVYRLAISCVLPAFSFAVLGCWGTETSWRTNTRKWLSIGLFASGLAIFVAPVLNLTYAPDLFFYKLLSFATVFTVVGWLLHRAFWKTKRLMTMLTIISAFGFLCYQDSLVYWHPWRVSQGTIRIIPRTQGIDLPSLETEHCYQFTLAAEGQDYVIVTINVLDGGTGSLNMLIMGRYHSRSPDLLIEEYNELLGKEEMTTLVAKVDHSQFWDLTEKELNKNSTGVNFWLFKGRHGERQKKLAFRCPDFRLGSFPNTQQTVMFNLGLTFLRLARAPYRKILLMN